MVEMQRQHVTSTKNAGSSLANCDFVSAKTYSVLGKSRYTFYHTY